MIHSKIFIECLQYAKHYFRQWNSEQNRLNTCFHSVYPLVCVVKGSWSNKKKRWWFKIKWKMQKRKMICTMLFFLLYSTGNSTQYSVMAYMGKESKKEWRYICVCVCVCVCSVCNWFRLLHSRSYYIIVNQLYSNKNFKNMILAMPCIQLYEQWWKEAGNKVDGMMQLWTISFFCCCSSVFSTIFFKNQNGDKNHLILLAFALPYFKRKVSI